jgi:hypothetical protein
VLVDPLGHHDWGADRDQAEFPQVSEDDADDTKRKIDV